ncbi:MAG: helix-turn-helix domain-containing protein [Rhodothermales bacterium]|nr:helix-turn-helix domain-containing protein [Rhodothermales bacterium]
MVDSRTSQQLLTLREAAERLNVHPATLRRWADKGDILVMVTPGGHRRFPVSEIERLSGDRGNDETAESVGTSLVEAAIKNARSEIAGHPKYSWAADMDETELIQMRAMGRHVMSLLERFVAEDDDDSTLIRAAESMGREYAASTKGIGMNLPAVLQAVTFFRDRILEAAVSLPAAARMNQDSSRRLIRRVNTFLNTILLSVAASFEPEP